MRAIAIPAFGGRDRMTLMDLPIPTIDPDEILIHVRAAGVGLWDAKMRENQGGMGGNNPTFPMILGWECAGVVAQVGGNITTLVEGDEVFAYASRRGNYAEYVACPITQVAKKPTSIDFASAAAMPISGITAHQAITEDLNVQSGETVFITAGAGGTGVFAIQIAAARGAHVITTAHTRNHAFLHELGASETLDYSQTDVVQAILAAHPGGVDAALECLGGENFDPTLKTVRDGGRIVCIVGLPPHEPRPNVAKQAIYGRPDSNRLATLARMVDEGKLKVPVQEVLPLAEAAHAHELVEAGHVKGKIVLAID